MTMRQKVRKDLEVQSRYRQREIEIQETAKKPRIALVEVLHAGTHILKNSTNSFNRGSNFDKSLTNQIKETIKIELLNEDSGTKRD